MAEQVRIVDDALLYGDEPERNAFIQYDGDSGTFFAEGYDATSSWTVPVTPEKLRAFADFIEQSTGLACRSADTCGDTPLKACDGQTVIDPGALIDLLARFPEWRFFTKYGEEFVYDRKKALFRYEGWDHYNDWVDVRIRNLRATGKLRKKAGGAAYMYHCATIEGNTLRLWNIREWNEKTEPELTLKVVAAVNLESEINASYEKVRTDK